MRKNEHKRIPKSDKPTNKGPAVLAGVLVLAFGLRLIVAHLICISTFDTGTVGLMGVNILRGDRPLFFYGQQYMGALEAYVAALMFFLFGVSETALALAPILFSVGWVAGTYLLFSEMLDRRAGLAAALVIAVPGWHTLWYSIGAYGGYPGTFCFGTWALWICLRLARRQLAPRSEWGHILALGLLAGVGLWTNYQIGIYLAVGAVLVAGYLVRVRLAPRVLLKFLAASLLFIVGIAPVLWVSLQGSDGGTLTQWNFNMPFLRHTFRMMTKANLKNLFLWKELPQGLIVAGGVSLGAGLVLYVVRIVQADGMRERLRLLIPAFFCILFLAMYLPHRMAALHAPRYMISFWMMLLCAAFAVPVTLRRRALRWTAWGFLAIWLVYNVAGTIQIVGRKKAARDKQLAARIDLVQKARQAGVQSVYLVGGYVFGYMGQALGMYAEGDIRFVSVFGERYHPFAQAVEADPDYAMACERGNRKEVGNALKDLQVDYEMENGPWATLFHRLHVPAIDRTAIDPDQIEVTLHGRTQGEGSFLVDRVRDTTVSGVHRDPPSGFTLDLGSERTIGSLWMLAPDAHQFGLPARYALSISSDGAHFEEIHNSGKRIPAAYTCHNRVYMKGYYAWFECRFEPVQTRYLRLTVDKIQRKQKYWELSEVYVFEHDGEGPAYHAAEAMEMAEELKRRGVTFTLCDRWLSARLHETMGAGSAYPRFNTRHSGPKFSRLLKPRKGLAVAVDRAVADDCQQLLNEVYGRGFDWQRVEFPHYVAFICNPGEEREAEDTGRRLVWTGFSLLKANTLKEMEF